MDVQMRSLRLAIVIGAMTLALAAGVPTSSAGGLFGERTATYHAEGFGCTLHAEGVHETGEGASERWRFQLWKEGDNCDTAYGVDCIGFGSLYNGFVPLGDACQVHFNLGGTFDEDHREDGGGGYELGISCPQGGGLGCGGDEYEVFIYIDHTCAWGYVTTNGGILLD